MLQTRRACLIDKRIGAFAGMWIAVANTIIAAIGAVVGGARTRRRLIAYKGRRDAMGGFVTCLRLRTSIRSGAGRVGGRRGVAAKAHATVGTGGLLAHRGRCAVAVGRASRIGDGGAHTVGASFGVAKAIAVGPARSLAHTSLACLPADAIARGRALARGCRRSAANQNECDKRCCAQRDGAEARKMTGHDVFLANTSGGLRPYAQELSIHCCQH
jgi:hypothetical protein